MIKNNRDSLDVLTTEMGELDQYLNRADDSLDGLFNAINSEDIPYYTDNAPFPSRMNESLSVLELNYSLGNQILLKHRKEGQKPSEFFPFREDFLFRQKALILEYTAQLNDIQNSIIALQSSNNAIQAKPSVHTLVNMQNRAAQLNSEYGNYMVQYLNESSSLYYNELTVLAIMGLIILFCGLLLFDRTRLKLYRFLVQRFMDKANPIEKQLLPGSKTSNSSNDKKKMKHEISEQLDRAYLKTETLNILKNCGSLEEIMNAIFTVSNNYVQYERVSVLFIDSMQENVILEFVKTSYNEIHLEVGYSEKLENSTLSTIYYDKRIRINEDLTLVTNSEEVFGLNFLKKEGLRSNITIPVCRGQNVFAYIILSSFKVNQFKENTIELIIDLVDSIGVALENQYRRRIELFQILDSIALLNQNQINRSRLETIPFEEVCYKLALKLSLEEATGLEMSAKLALYIKRCANLLDIGEMFLPPGLLDKNSRFTEIEREMMKQHVDLGMTYFNKLRTSPLAYHSQLLQIAEDIIHYHHENFDGTGYPDQNEALAMINEMSGTKFNPLIVNAFNEVMVEILQ